MLKKALLATAIAASLPMSAMAVGPIDGKIYGKINLSYDSVSDDVSGDDVTELNSNASRFGVKGKSELSEGLYAIYKIEWEVNIDEKQDDDVEVDTDTGKGGVDRLDLNTRNRYIGLTGDFGTVFAGTHDTPHKLAQKKIDLFNDLTGDIKNSLDSENRASDIVNYTSPKIADAVTISVAHIASEKDGVDDGVSASISYDQGGLYLAAAYETDVEGEDIDSTRFVVQYNIDALQLGLLLEEHEEADGDSEDAYTVSVAYKIGKAKLKAQYSETEILASKLVENEGEDGQMFSLGVDYKLGKKTKAFAYYTAKENDDNTVEEDTFGIGLEHKF